ncbi:hypothetical protein AK812_SmicGene37341 [Symbiodinium microadriaticum]|uniref:Uncharacterized protein n=1 Tax=Symbiodinium microadriaticum TaxID=2951 RepID=A0A1Q9CGJ4_SYMMI|nr:hypothetical protein AK812_SmicGene37341 [Symbiodinium microadriaticum]
MADHCVQRDFFWRLSFKGGTDCDRAQLLGQDLIKDLEASEGICQQLRTHAESMKTGNMTKAFRFLVEEISDIRKSVSKEQWELQKICRKMGWPSGTTKIAEDKGHAIIEEEALPRFREYLQDSRKEPILKHHVVVSPAYLPLLEKLMAERLTGERQPKLSPPTRNELPSDGFLSPEEKADILKQLRLTLEDKLKSKQARKLEVEQKRANVNAMLSEIPRQFDEVSILSLDSRRTKTTGILAKHTFKVNLVALPSVWKDSEVDDGAGVSSQSEIFNLVAERLCEMYGISISGDALRDIFFECCELEDKMSRAGDVSDVSEDPASPDASIEEVEDFIQELGKGDFELGDKHKFAAYWMSAVPAFEQEVVIKYLLSKAKTLAARWSGDQIPREAFEEIEQQLMQSTMHCFTFQSLSKCFIHRVQNSDVVFRRAARGLLLELDVDELFGSAPVEKQPDTANLEELVFRLAGRACVALRKAALHAEKYWQEAVALPAKMRWQEVRDAAAEKCRGKPGPKIYRSDRVRRNTLQTYGSWMCPPSKEVVKQAKTATYRITHNM